MQNLDSPNDQRDELSLLVKLRYAIAPTNVLAADKDVWHGALTGLLEQVRLDLWPVLHLVQLKDLGSTLLVWDGSNELFCSFRVRLD